MTGRKAKLSADVMSVDMSWQPGWADVVIRLFDGTDAVMTEKLPVIGMEPADKTVGLDCVIVDDSGGDFVRVRLCVSNKMLPVTSP